MSSVPGDGRGWSLEARLALQRGDARAARELFERATASGAADADTWYGLSLALKLLGEARQESAALDRLLEQAPHHLAALVRKGDLYTQEGDRRAGMSYYRVALKVAARTPGLTAQWRAELARVEAICQESMRAYEEHLFADLRRRGLGDPGTERFGRAMDLVLGRRQIYHQQPRYFHFPELPEIAFFDRDAFAWGRALEAATSQIQAELEAVLADGTGIEPYMRREDRRPTFNRNGLLEDPSWSAFHLLKKGQAVPGNAERCPATLAALAQVPLCTIPGRTPTVLFSILRPGAHIPPHNGYINIRLICHLPLVVPPECALRVASETRPWREGELMIFDDTIEHEAWNRSSRVRAVLLFDIWRPELTDIERSLVAAMLESIDRFGGVRHEWNQ